MAVAGHLQEKKGYYYAVINYNDENGKRKTKWFSTKIKAVKGNKKKAEDFLMTLRTEFEVPTEISVAKEKEPYFEDYMIYWLEVLKPNISLITYANYYYNVHSIIVPYFRGRNITLPNLKAQDIQDFYTYQLKRVKPNSVIKYHANIRKALEYAVKMDKIEVNPIYKVERPKRNTFVGGFYDNNELKLLIEAIKGTPIELAVWFGFYGLRRSEVLGLKWSAINLDTDTVLIKHTVMEVCVDGKKRTIAEDKTKNKTSRRTLPLVRPLKEKLIEWKERQEYYKKKFKKGYNTEYSDYVMVNEIGELMRPNYISDYFSRLLRENNLKKIRFHDLRHTCASLLLANNIPMKQIQDWLGHSDFSTTANIYAHLDYNSKLISAGAMESIIIK